MAAQNHKRHRQNWEFTLNFRRYKDFWRQRETLENMATIKVNRE